MVFSNPYSPCRFKGRERERDAPTLSPMDAENGYMLKGNFYWRDPFLTSMIMGGRVNSLHPRSPQIVYCLVGEYCLNVGRFRNYHELSIICTDTCLL